VRRNRLVGVLSFGRDIGDVVVRQIDDDAPVALVAVAVAIVVVVDLVPAGDDV
jgi:hypothetical protein